MKNVLIILLLFAYFDSEAINYKFGKVSKDEVVQNAHPMEPTADAAILYQEGSAKLTYNTTTSRFEIIREVYKRIKIYDHSTTQYGELSIPYYNHSWNTEKVTNVKGTVYNSVNGKIKESKVKKDHMFDEKVTKYRGIKKIAFPNIQKGSVIEIKYKIVTPYSSRIPQWKFQHDIPCDKNVYTVEYPEWFTYNVSSKGDSYIQTQKKTANRSIQFKHSYDASTNSLVVNRKTSVERVPYLAHIATYSTEYVPALEDEDFVPYMDNYRSAISFELLRTQMPNSNPKAYTESWAGISRMINDHEEIGSLIDNKVKGSDDIIATAKKLPQEERANFIYNYVRDNFTWNSYYGIRSDVGLKNLMKEKSGNIADINLLLCNLLRKADVSASLVATRSRDYGFINATHPSQLDLNYLLVQVKNEDGDHILIDASEKDVEYGHLPGRALNLRGITINSSGGKEIAIKNPNTGSSKIVAKAAITDDMTLDFFVKSKYKKYAAVMQSKHLSSVGDEDELMDHYESVNEDRSYESFVKHTSKGTNEEVSTEEQFGSDSGIEEINGKIYIDAFFGLLDSDNPFTAETRTLPIFRDQTINQKTIVALDIPEGYSIESVPEGLNIALPESMEKFTYTVSTSADKIIVNITVNENSDILNPSYYEGIKKYYEMIQAKASEKIVLAKT